MNVNGKKAMALALALTMSLSMVGCKSSDAKEMVAGIESGKTPEIKVAAPSAYSPKASNVNKAEIVWTQLDQIKTHNMGFRQSIDEIFKTNIIKEANGGSGGKQSCLYVVNIDGNDRYSGNTTLMDAFRNKKFITEYWEDQLVLTELNKLASEAYKDLNENSPLAIEGVLNAYYNLIGTYGDNFDGYEALTREEFYAFLVRATQGVYDIEPNEAYMTLSDSHRFEGEDTSRSREDALLAGSVEKYNFINTDNKGLTPELVDKHISRLEAIYMVVNMFLSEQYNNVGEKDTAFSDNINGGDIALKIGFKEEVKNPDKTTQIVEKDMWQMYTLSYMLSHTDKAMQSELYNALVVAKQYGLITGTNSRWNEAISKDEAINLIINTAKALNRLEGYKTQVEYAEMEAYVPVEDEPVVEEIDESKILYDLASLPGELITVFTEAYEEVDQDAYDDKSELLKAQLNKVVEICNRDNIEIIESYDLAFREWRKGMVKSTELRFREAYESVNILEYSTDEELNNARLEVLEAIYAKSKDELTDDIKELFLKWVEAADNGEDLEINPGENSVSETPVEPSNTGEVVFDADGYEIDPVTGKRKE